MNTTSFTDLGIAKDILRNLQRMKFEKPTPVQQLSIARVLAGEDLLVQAPTGTGKTGAFGMPIIQRTDCALRSTQALILCPTRELALQITGVLRSLSAGNTKIRICTVFGGENINKQFAALRHVPHIIVATPGRLLDHMQRKTLSLSAIRTVVLDEADRMLDMGFKKDMEKILQATPASRQTLLFSATIPQEIRAIASEFQKQAGEVRIAQASLAVETVKQYYTAVQPGGKNDALIALLSDDAFPLSLVFVNMKHRADKVALQLRRKGLRAAALHGDMKQSQRDRVMQQYRLGELDTLIATDVAARGIDVKNIGAVINYDTPLDDESYVHRIGRTGRADREGTAYTLIYQEEADRLRKMIHHLRIEVSPTADTLPLPEPVAAQIPHSKTRGQSADFNTNRGTYHAANRSVNQRRGTPAGTQQERLARQQAQPVRQQAQTAR